MKSTPEFAQKYKAMQLKILENCGLLINWPILVVVVKILDFSTKHFFNIDHRSEKM